MTNIARMSAFVLPFAALAACNPELEPAAEVTPGLSESFEEIQMQYPQITPEIFNEYDRDGDGMLSPLEQDSLSSDIADPDGIGGQVGGLDDDGV